ncbi:MAG TPA: rod shape-determining protein MreC [Candidatus Limisoma intestinavium]|uniref:Cell shape-determining protein MreC n=1 Tax=Candidatus Limisoma intestinavium TaxID=2840856 RepID=A0A9D1IKV5_9BACT|nr:rod shape-determining protein MreC [Candidatus Limisoma intestinavium]
MKNLINFFIRHSSWIVFTFYAVVSCWLLFKNNPYQQYVFLTSANKVSATVYKGSSKVTSYFNLQSINADLQRRNASLEMEVINLKRQIRDYRTLLLPDSINLPDSIAQNYEYHFATVINNSVAKPKNFITLDKGRADGISPEMGVVDQNGVVGIVSTVNDHASRVISLLNPDMRLSCKVKNTDYFGSLVWHGVDPRYATLEEMPKHVKFNKGDTIVTSGYSAVFPPGLLVGTIEDMQQATDNNFFSLRIKLSTDFTRLSTVRVIKSKYADEIKQLEQD